ncbi:MAG: hypothetical protein CMH63_00050 [Nanoarchaeota archaeon]|jgi:hypothetical protein|nr:hypothetical protein [Nanoarchaeota archaeon]|tara:strand:- start:3751 stop:4053 length:303 start_codon:yes stop_codon:yes gene_type:complete
MAFSKSFPKTEKGSTYPSWEEVYLSEEEEKEIEEGAKRENHNLMKECIDRAKEILTEKKLDYTHSNVISTAIALFDKIASHSVYHKEAKAKEKFDMKFGK